MKYTRMFFLGAALLLLASRTFAQGAEKYIINHFVNDPKVIEAHLVITDVQGKGPIVNMTFYDNDGNVIGKGKELIQPYGKLNLNPEKYVSKVA
ncbi:MAG: hypothetical protein C0600_14360, partial [Ignavibacteria bacterium]